MIRWHRGYLRDAIGRHGTMKTPQRQRENGVTGARKRCNGGAKRCKETEKNGGRKMGEAVRGERDTVEGEAGSRGERKEKS